MENTESNFAQNTPSPIPQPKWFHNPWFSRGTLIIALLFFFMPFVNINCSGTKLASIKGTDMVFGSELKPDSLKTEKVAEKVEEAVPSKDSVKEAINMAADSLTKALSGLSDSLTTGLNQAVDSLNAGLDALGDSLTAGLSSMGDSLKKGFTDALKDQNPFMGNDMMGGKDKKIEPNVLAITAFSFIIIALILSFFRQRAVAVVAGVLALISTGSLFYIKVHMTHEFEKQMGPFNFIPITFEFTNFYWLCVIFVLLAGIFSFIRSSYKAV